MKYFTIIHRIKDNDDKLIVVPNDKSYYDDAIGELVEFKEKYFKHILIRKLIIRECKNSLFLC